jgi:hypothetical protein
MTIPSELSERIEKIISAAEAHSWTDFNKLSDKPFVNESTMREQFENSSLKLQEWRRSWVVDTVIHTDYKDGTRVVIATISPEPNLELPIILTLYATDEGVDSSIRITTFFQDIEHDF